MSSTPRSTCTGTSAASSPSWPRATTSSACPVSSTWPSIKPHSSPTTSTSWPSPAAQACLARKGDPRRQPLPKPSLPGLEYSFSGLKTALLYRLRDLGQSVTDQDRADLAAAFEQSVVESLLEKLNTALDREPAAEVVVAGGGAAKSLLRKRGAEGGAGRARPAMPPLELGTDNAAT